MNASAVLSVLVQARGVSAVNTQLATVQGQLTKTAAVAESSGMRMKKAFAFGAAGIALGVGLSVKAASDFEAAFAEVRKTVDATEKQYQQLEKGIRRLSTQIPESADELARIAGVAGQLGIKRKDVLAFTKTVAQLGTTTNLKGEAAAETLARIANIMGTSQKDYRRMGSAIVDLGNNLAATESDITSMSMRIAGAGKQIGLTEPQVFSLAGALSSVGIGAEAGGSAISRSMIGMANSVASGNEKLKTFASTAGMSVDKFKRLFERDAAGALVLFIEGLDDIRKSGGNVFETLDKLGMSEIRVRDAMLRASGAGDLLRKSLEIGSRAWEENSALTEEANKRYETLQAQLQMLKNQFVDYGIAIGQKFLPTLKEAVGILRDPKLDAGQKFSKIVGLLSDSLTRGLEEGVRLAEQYGPKIVAGIATGMFNAWAGMSPLAKLFTAGVIVRAVGGKGAVSAAGAMLGKWLGVGIAGGAAAGVAGGAAAGGASAGVAAGMAGGAAAGGGMRALGRVFTKSAGGVLIPAGTAAGSAAGAAAGGAAGLGMASKLGTTLKTIRWGRVGALAAGLALADGVMDSYNNRIKQRSDDLFTAIQAKAQGGGGMEDLFRTAFGFDDGAKKEVASWIQSTLDAINAGKRINLSTTTWFREHDIESLKETVGLTQAQEVAMRRLYALARQAQGLNVGVDLDMDPKALQRLKNGLQQIRQGVYTNTNDMVRVSRRNMRIIAEQFGTKTAEGRKLTQRNLIATAMAYRTNMVRSGNVTEEGLRRILRLIRRADLVSPTREKARGFAREWARGFERSGTVTRGGVQRLLREMKTMPAPMRQVAWDTFWPLIQQARRQGKLTGDEVKKLRSNVVSRFGDIKTKASQSSRQTADTVINNTRRMTNQSSAALSQLQTNVNNALSAYGAKGVSFSLGSSGKQTGGWIKRQTGGVVPGYGNGDSYPMALPHGSFILNRKASAAYGFSTHATGGHGYGNVLLEPGERVFYPDEVGRIGKSNLERMNRKVSRFQDGGSLDVPKGLSGFQDLSQVDKPLLRGPDPLRAIGQGGIDLAHKAAQRYLIDHMPKGGAGAGTRRNYPGVSGDTDFGIALGMALSRLAKATVGHISVTSGWRSVAEQAALFAANPNPRMVAPPGKSNHGQGIAADISPQVGAYGGKERQFGLHFPMSWEPWHIELMQLGGYLKRMARGGWHKTGYTTYSGSGGYMGDLGSKPAYAELGTATTSGATGTGYMAQLFGMKGELPHNFPVDVRIGSKVGTLYKQDRGWGQGTSAYSIDIHTSGFGEVGLSGHNKGTAWLRAGEGGGGGTVDRSAQRKRQQVAAIKAARKKVQEAKTVQGRTAAYWKLLDTMADYSELGKKGRKWVLGRVHQVAAQPNPNRKIGPLQDIAQFWQKHGEVTGAAKPDKQMSKAFERARNAGERIRKRKAKRIFNRISSKGLNYPGKKSIKQLGRKGEVLAELVERLEALHSSPGSAPGGALGTELTDAEVASQISKNKELLDTYLLQRNKAQRNRKWLTGYIGNMDRMIKKASKKNSPLRWKLKAFRKGRSNAVSSRGELNQTLTDLQGVSGKKGAIFDVRQKLNELNYTDTYEKTNAESLASERAELLQELLRSANLRNAVLVRQYGVLNPNGMPYMGAFRSGGVAWVGENGPELAHLPSGTRVHSNGDTRRIMESGGRGDINVRVIYYEGEDRADVEIDDRKVEAIVERINRRSGRAVGSVPGRGGYRR